MEDLHPDFRRTVNLKIEWHGTERFYEINVRGGNGLILRELDESYWVKKAGPDYFFVMVGGRRVSMPGEKVAMEAVDVAESFKDAIGIARVIALDAARKRAEKHNYRLVIDPEF